MEKRKYCCDCDNRIRNIDTCEYNCSVYEHLIKYVYSIDFIFQTDKCIEDKSYRSYIKLKNEVIKKSGFYSKEDRFERFRNNVNINLKKTFLCDFLVRKEMLEDSFHSIAAFTDDYT